MATSIFKDTNLELCDILYYIYQFILNTRVIHVSNNCNISEHSYINLKNKILPLCKNLLNNHIRKIGGNRKTVSNR